MDRLIHHGPGFAWSLRIVGFISLGIGLFAALFVEKRLENVKETPFFDLEAFKNKGFSLLMAGQFIVYFSLFFECESQEGGGVDLSTFWICDLSSILKTKSQPRPFLLLLLFQDYYLPAIGGIQGMPTTKIFYLASASNGCSLIGRILAGILGDSIGRFNILIASTITCSIIVFSTIAAVHLTGDSITAPLFLIASFYGFFSGAFFTTQTVVVTMFSTDPRRVGTWIGMLYAVVAIPALFGAPVGAVLFQNHGFPPALIFSGGVILLGSGFLLMSRQVAQKKLHGQRI